MFSIVTPVHNEEAVLEANAKKLVSFLEPLKEDFELVLVENGSVDSTLGKANELAAEDSRIRVFSIPEKDLGAALRRGLREASGDRIIWYPIDLSVDLSYIPSSLAMLADLDVVVGSKEHPGSTVKRSGARKLLSFLYNSLVNLLFGLGISDTQCVKTFRADVIKPLAEKAVSSGIMWEVELLYLAKKRGLRLKEVPVSVCDMRKGSKIKVFDMVKAFWNLLMLRLRI